MDGFSLRKPAVQSLSENEMNEKRMKSHEKPVNSLDSLAFTANSSISILESHCRATGLPEFFTHSCPSCTPPPAEVLTPAWLSTGSIPPHP
jgi:hypothetical protein